LVIVVVMFSRAPGVTVGALGVVSIVSWDTSTSGGTRHSVHRRTRSRSGSTRADRVTALVPVSQLTIDTTPSAPTVTPGALLNITTTITNTGQTPYFGISVTFSAPGLGSEGTSGGDQTASSGTLSVGTDGAVWTGNIPVGGTVTITGSIIVNNPYTGNPVLSITDVTTAPGSNCPAGAPTRGAS